SGENETEKGARSDNGEIIVEVNKDFFRPAEVELLRADASKAKEVLGWEPTVTFSRLVEIMVENDIEELS
ncbi:GDP-mannose 4,6-dehydratase, partial [candidate division WWE3 bacterium CG_4_9_14_3_um_filter_39_7]